MTDTSRALFVPLKAEYFADFWSRTKDTEYRLYGPRWNERTCRVGRAVTLSLGYGKRQRLRGTIVGFIAEPLALLDTHTHRELRALFGIEDTLRKIACIRIDVHGAEPHP